MIYSYGYSVVDSYSAINCSREGADEDGNGGTLSVAANTKYCGNVSSLANDSWAGAQKVCYDMGMTVPEVDVLENICRTVGSELGISSYNFWSSTMFSHKDAHRVSFWYHCTRYTPYGYGRGSYHAQTKVLCIN